MKKLILLIILIVAAFGIFAFQNQLSNSQNPRSKIQKLKAFSLALDWVPNTNHTGIYVARAKGWYEDEGLDLKILPYSEVSSNTLVYENKADVGISSTESVVMQTGSKNPVISIAAIINSNTSGLITLKDKGIKSPRDLDNKTYGGFGLPYENAVVREVIQSDGGKGIFTNVILETAAMDALASGRIDFVWVFEGWDKIAANIENIETNYFPIKDYGVPDYYTPVIITGPKQMDAKKDLLAKFMRATQKGYAFAIANPDDAAKILIAQNPKGTFPNEELISKSQKFLSKTYAPNDKTWGIQDRKFWRDYPKFMIDNKTVTDKNGNPIKSIDFESLYTNKFLE